MNAPRLEHYDAIVIGSGQGGKPLSIALAKAGWNTAIVESGSVGGTCINTGCTPSKTLIASARVAYLADRAASFGVDTGPVTADLEKVQQRKRVVVDQFRDGVMQALSNTPNLTLVPGEASFTNIYSIQVRMHSDEIRHLTAEKIFINTGGRPFVPELSGLSNVPFLDSTSAMELEELPEHLLILGGSYVSVELGQMFRRLGSRVSIIERGTYLLSHEDPDVGASITSIMREEGIQVFLQTLAIEVSKNSGGGINLNVRTPNGERPINGSHLLVVMGRVPNTAALNLRAAGVAADERGYIRVNSKLETNIAGVYALGDVNGGPAFTHIAYDDFRIIRANLLENAQMETTARILPYTVFIDPQLGRVGLTETEARKQGKKIRVAVLPMSRVARAIEASDTRGFMKAIVDADSGQILGAAVLGSEGGEVMSMLQLAMMGKMPYTLLRDAIFAHPTWAESLNNLFMTLDD